MTSAGTMVMLVDNVNTHLLERRRGEPIDSTPRVGTCIHDTLGLHGAPMLPTSHTHLVDDDIRTLTVSHTYGIQDHDTAKEVP